MNYAWIEEYCMAKKAAEKEYKPDWEATLYKIHGKMFAMLSNDAKNKPILNVKSEPTVGQTMRNSYRCIVAGYHMNKEHWNSIYLDGEVPDDVVKNMIDSSYNLILHSFSKKVQVELLD